MFEWDELKNRANKAKHGLSFGVAILAFDDPFAFFEHNSTVNNEERYQVTGRIGDTMLIAMLVYTIRERKYDGQEIYRIISARKANPRERRRYEEAAY
jgi:uncharacterized DUF497 family protein